MSENEFVYSTTPSPHAYLPRLIDPEAFSQIWFPELPERPGGRIGRDLYPGEEGWEEIMAQPGWREFSSKFMSEKFVKSVIRLFAEDIKRNGALFDPDKVYLEPYRETRKETESSVLSTTHDPNALFARFDLQAIGQNYGKGVHCDHLRRVVGGVLFVTSAEDEGMEGGEFGLYSDAQFQNDRVCHSARLEKTFPVVRNTGVLFLNCNTGFHGPQRIRRIAGLRKWVYYSISSRRNVWTTSRVQPKKPEQMVAAR